MRLEMCNLYFRDKVKDLGWERVGIRAKICNLFVTLFREKRRICQILVGKYHYIRQVEIVLTTKCTLRCKECANLMQYYTNPYEVDKRIIIKSLCNLVHCLDEINTVVLIGGEPLIYKELAYVIENVSGFDKVNHIHIFTNGTVVPSEDAINALQNGKVQIIISDYGEISRKKFELQEFCKTNNIKCYLKNEDLYWGYVGNMKSRKRNEKQLKKQFRHCHNYCRSILNGKLFYCPRAAHGDDLEYVRASAREYVDLLQEKITTSDILNLVYCKHYFGVCNYCNYGTKDMIPIIPGVQMSIDEKKKIFEK